MAEMVNGQCSAEELLPLVYAELKALAAAKLAHEKPGLTLQPTALVHEAYLRMVGQGNDRHQPRFANRAHFFAAASEAMRRILVDNARRKQTQKLGGGMDRSEMDPAELAAPLRNDELLAVDEALDRLASEDATAAELVKLRYFVGLSIPEIAEVLTISPRSADRLWAFARAWLRRDISG